MKLSDIMKLYQNFDSTDKVLVLVVIVSILSIAFNVKIKDWLRITMYNYAFTKFINKNRKECKAKDNDGVIKKIETYYKDNKEKRKVDKKNASITANNIFSVDIVNGFTLIFTILITIYTIYFSLATNVQIQQIFADYQSVVSIDTDIVKETAGGNNPKLIKNLNTRRNSLSEEVKQLTEKFKEDLSPKEVFYQYLKFLMSFVITVAIMQYYINLLTSIKKSFYLLCIEIIEDIEKDEEQNELKVIFSGISQALQSNSEVAVTKSSNEYIEKGKVYKIILEKNNKR